MYENHGLTTAEIQDCLKSNCGLDIESVRFLDSGHDFRAFPCQVTASDGDRYFLKVRLDPIREPILQVPFALSQRGVQNLVPPIQGLDGRLWCPCNDYHLILYPFIAGENAKERPPSLEQWKEFGQTMQAVHSANLPTEVLQGIRNEDFSFPICKLVRNISALADHANHFEDSAAAQFAELWQDNTRTIEQLMARIEQLGSELQSREIEKVICHTDCHQWNMLVADDGHVYLIDWDDGPLLAPTERDLFLIVAPDITKELSAREISFLRGYGDVPIDLDGMAYFRVERTLEDIAVSGREIFHNPKLSEETKLSIVEDTRSFMESALVHGWRA